MRGAVVEQSVVGKTEDLEKEKKKKRRSHRRTKQNNSVSVCSSVNEIRGEVSELLESSGPSNCVISNESRLPAASYVAFHSLPPMHIYEQEAYQEAGNLQMPQPDVDVGERMISKSCPGPITCEESDRSYVNNDFLLCHQIHHAQKRYFAPHWSVDAVTVALEKGEVFKAFFRGNAHNRLEAYCKIEGVPTDVLISGVDAQNRAVDGDTVAIKIDPLSLWSKMKGSHVTSNNSGDDYSLLPEITEFVCGGCKGKHEVDVDFEYVNCNNCFLPGKKFHNGSSSFSGKYVKPELTGPAVHTCVNGHYASVLNPSQTDCSREQNGVVSAVGSLCVMLSSFPSKRPTGRVVSIIEKSPRRNAVVGFLNVKQCAANKEGYRKDTKKKKSLLSPNTEYITLTPTDPKFPKMIVLLRDLPDCIKKRLEDDDVTVQMELVSAQIVHWGEENHCPQARIMHIFGRGGEVEPNIAAILFENAILYSEFSPESLSCLPHLPWEVPLEECQNRRDLRNLCIFTIDPLTATDLDDALSVENLSNGVFRVGVHVADVSHFVLPDTALEIEAKDRSTSVYLLKHKLPMLPPLLSENLASLNPGVDRLAFSIFWDINISGEVLDRWIGRTVIKSCCKLSYNHAQDIIDGLFDVGSTCTLENGCPQLHGNFEWSDVIQSLRSLHKISKTLRGNRFNNGALSLDSSKVFLLFDEDGIPYDSMFFERKDSESLVEEFMLLANRTAAEVIYRAYPDSALLRRHPEPNLRKLREFESFCSKHGLELDTSSSGQFHHSLECIREKLKDDSVLFNILTMNASKPMQLATYISSGELRDGDNNFAHYALAVPLYTHFTSPLRRYPDIVVHRTLAATLEAEEMFLKHKRIMLKANKEEAVFRRCFSGIYFDKDAVESIEGREALSAAASKHRVPCTEVLADVAAYCNERKLAGRRAKDASEKLYMWVLLKKKEVFLSEARVLGLGPRFMSVYIYKLAIERRIYYDEAEDLMVEWLDSTSTLVLSLFANKRPHRRGCPGKWKTVEDVALIMNPSELKPTQSLSGVGGSGGVASQMEWVTDEASGNVAPISDVNEIEPAVFPLTVHVLSTIPVVLHAVGGDDGPIEIGVRLYMSSYFR